MRPPPPARRRAALAAAVATLAAACAACSPSGESPAPPPREPRDPHAAEGGAGVVERVVDGDTLVARISGLCVRVRLLGVDAPETAGDAAECYGQESTRTARRLLPKGAPIALMTDGTQGPFDRFGRRLAEVTVQGHRRTANEALIAAGAAEVFRGDGRARLLPALLAAEEAARDAGRGLWAACRGG